MASIILSIFFNLLLLLNPNKIQASHGLHVDTSNSSDEMVLLAFKSAITYDPLNSVTTWSKNFPSHLTPGQPFVWKYSITIGFSPKFRVDHLWSQQFHGTIPWELGMLDELSLLALNANHLTGQIPSSLSNCTFLEVLDINDNNISGEIPGEFFSKTTNLMELYLAINQLTSGLPVSLFNCSQLEQLEVSGNRLSGIVPTELGKLYRLIWLNLGYNQFTSGSKSTLSILTALTNCSLLEFITLSGNHLTGVMPSSVGQLSTKLTELDLDGNKITGEISPYIGNLTNLTLLSLQQNLLTGVIPSKVSQLQSLEQLYIASNKLEGTIPSEIGKLKTLGALDLEENKLSGSIPDSLAHLQQLRYLYLNNNQLSGIIPPSLGECLKLEDLDLDLSYKQLRGHIPPQVVGLSNLLRGFNLSNNLLQGPLPLELSKLDMVKAIDISANQLTGHIPFVLGSCVALEYLNLSSNQIEGPIPDSLGKLQNLQDLDFSSNKLSGRIPMSLGNLKELQRLNFSMNRLSGEVPKDGVFKILGPSSFIQNLVNHIRPLPQGLKFAMSTFRLSPFIP
ncbi:hypothetical protein SUGI_0291140 [Cryptomeria japonica]|nr:hypothetical protein SUGI_0291140 [Cryptomeria japonica]